MKKFAFIELDDGTWAQAVVPVDVAGNVIVLPKEFKKACVVAGTIINFDAIGTDPGGADWGVKYSGYTAEGVGIEASFVDRTATSCKVMPAADGVFDITISAINQP